jgi:probable HAF family extracellular repeat protein
MVYIDTSTPGGLMTVIARGMTAALAVPVVMIAAGTVAPAAASAAPALPLYQYVDLGAIGKPGQVPGTSEAAGLNNSRTVVGYSTHAPQFSPRASSWRDGVLTDLGTLSDSPLGASGATAVNDSGTVVGSTNVEDDREPGHAFRYSDGVMTDLGTGYGPGSASSAADVNGSGVVVGTHTERRDSPDRAVVWRDGQIIDLGTFGGDTGPYGTDSIAHSVNESGQVVGGAAVPGGALHAFLWDGGVLRDLGTLGGTTGSTFATGINDRGVVVGASPNRAGQVIGASRVATTGNYDHRPFLWQNGQMVDLNDRVPDLPAGVTLYSASDINDRGEVVGWACPFDCEAGGFHQRRAFLLVPLR